MGKRRDRRHFGGRLSAWLPVVLVLAVVASAFAAFQFDLAVRWGWAEDEPADPAAVAPPAGLDLPALTTPAPVAATAPTDSTVSAAKVRRALAPYVDDKDLGKHRVVAVGSLDGRVWADNDAGAFVPASTMKLLTGTAAIESLGPDRTFRTTVVAGKGPRSIVLVGGGDPFLTLKPEKDEDLYPRRADIRTLATATAAALRADGRTTVRLGFDDSLFTGPSVNPHWPATYIPEAVVPPITALWVDKGAKRDTWGFESDPSAAAAMLFADELRRAGVKVTGAPRRTTAADGADELAAVESAPVWQVVDRVVSVSDNEGAEILSHHVGIAEGNGGSFAGGAQAVRAVLGRLGVPLAGAVIRDGSGLSREDRLTTQTLLGVLAVDAATPELRSVIGGLPVAGFTGSLTSRLADSPEAGAGRVRAKTGTLTGVHGLAGVTTDLDGNVLTFVVLADKVAVEDTLAARDTLDDMAAALAACHCSP